MNSEILTSVEKRNEEYKDLKLDDIVDYEEYKLYSIVTSSTQLEGSTLDELDTAILLNDGLTAKGKPILHHKMVEDNFNAISYAMKAADDKVLLSPEFIRKLNSLNMAQTGEIRYTMSGDVVDGTKGEFRKDSRFAQAIGTYPDFKKVPGMVDDFCEFFNRQLEDKRTSMQYLITSFEAHVSLVLIHPFMDGNKRTSRLLMNFIQRRQELPLTKVHKEDSREYIEALKKVKDTEDIKFFNHFMLKQHAKTLRNEIQQYQKSNKKSMKFLFSL